MCGSRYHHHTRESEDIFSQYMRIYPIVFPLSIVDDEQHTQSHGKKRAFHHSSLNRMPKSRDGGLKRSQDTYWKNVKMFLSP